MWYSASSNLRYSINAPKKRNKYRAVVQYSNSSWRAFSFQPALISVSLLITVGDCSLSQYHTSAELECNPGLRCWDLRFEINAGFPSPPLFQISNLKFEIKLPRRLTCGGRSGKAWGIRSVLF